MSNAGTRYSMMVTKVPDFVSTMSTKIKCNHCGKLLEKKKPIYCLLVVCSQCPITKL